MSDQLVHLTGIQKREAEQALGRELKPVGPEGDLFKIPVEVAQHLGELPPSPPKAEDSLAVKVAVQQLPLGSDNADGAAEAPEAHDQLSVRSGVTHR